MSTQKLGEIMNLIEYAIEIAVRAKENFDDYTAAVLRVIDKRQSCGASDESIIKYLERLKSKTDYSKLRSFFDAIIGGVRASPSMALDAKDKSK